jgi:hypothetical protein
VAAHCVLTPELNLQQLWSATTAHFAAVVTEVASPLTFAPKAKGQDISNNF